MWLFEAQKLRLNFLKFTFYVLKIVVFRDTITDFKSPCLQVCQRRRFANLQKPLPFFLGFFGTFWYFLGLFRTFANLCSREGRPLRFFWSSIQNLSLAPASPCIWPLSCHQHYPKQSLHHLVSSPINGDFPLLNCSPSALLYSESSQFPVINIIVIRVYIICCHQNYPNQSLNHYPNQSHQHYPNQTLHHQHYLDQNLHQYPDQNITIILREACVYQNK